MKVDQVSHCGRAPNRQQLDDKNYVDALRRKADIAQERAVSLVKQKCVSCC